MANTRLIEEYIRDSGYKLRQSISSSSFIEFKFILLLSMSDTFSHFIRLFQRRVPVHISLIPCSGAENHTGFLSPRQTAQIPAKICQRLIGGGMLRVCRRHDQVKGLIPDLLITGKTAVDHRFHLRTDGVEIHGRRKDDHIRRLERIL